MSKRFFTSDWHLCSSRIIEACDRPFKDVDFMNKYLISMTNNFASEDDIVIHAGDFCSYGNDRGEIGMKINPINFVKQINATFINVKGNHDENNKTKSVCYYMRTTLGKVFSDVSLSHYPSINPLAKGTFRSGDIHLCGHIHNRWKYLIDKKHKVLNINVGIDVWDYKIVSEDELIDYIRHVMRQS